MDDVQAAVTPAPKYEDIAGLIDYVLLRTELSESDIADGCALARRYQIPAVVVRPSDVDLAIRWVGGPVLLATEVESYGATAVKTFATRDMLRRGVKQIDTAMNTGKLISRQFQYLETELMQMADACHQNGAVLNVFLESQHLNEELKIVACRVCRRAGVDAIGSDNPEDMPLLKEYSKDRLALKSWRLVESLEGAQALRDLGFVRMRTLNPAPILEAWKAKLAEQTEPGPVIT